MRAWVKLSVSMAAASPIRSCIPPEARRMRLPMRCMGRAASGYRQAAIRLNTQSSHSMEATRPITVIPFATPPIARVRASRMIAASVVKRAASCAGDSRSTRARSASVSTENMRACNSRIVRSTSDWVSTVWP